MLLEVKDKGIIDIDLEDVLLYAGGDTYYFLSTYTEAYNIVNLSDENRKLIEEHCIELHRQIGHIKDMLRDQLLEFGSDGVSWKVLQYTLEGIADTSYDEIEKW